MVFIFGVNHCLFQPIVLVLFLVCGQLGYLLGMVASWFVCRIKNCYPFYFVALLLIIGVVCSFCINGPSDVVRLIIAQFLINLGMGDHNAVSPHAAFQRYRQCSDICYFI
ncbi:membrane protein [Salmonella enterica subsp. enterica]|uniref:Membrane protein n=1 Tax=Salmonella enterica I TaxID=59201 RepID=A0A447TQK0_SALET|nr:membrane protein [Salmonella enterica subsp. enterica]